MEAIVALAATCQAFHSFQKTNDSYFWGQLVMRDYRFILVGEAQRKAQIKLEAEGKTKFKLKVRREDLPQALGSYRNLYAEVSKCLQTAPAGIREVRPYAAMFLNHTTFVRYVFAAYDMIRGVNSWDGDIIVQYGDSVQTNVMVLDFGCNKTVYLHAQLVKWSFGLADMYKGMGLQGDAVSERTCLRWSYWQTFKPRTDYSGYYLSKINSTNNAVKWSTTGHYFVKQWVKTRFYLSLDAPFQNPGPYPAVRVKDSETDEKPYFEFLYQIDNA